MDLKDSVVLPREDFIELQTAAWDQPPLSGKERIENTLQTTALLTAAAGAITLAAWGWVKAKDWLEERNFERRVRAGEVPRRNPASR